MPSWGRGTLRDGVCDRVCGSGDSLSQTRADSDSLSLSLVENARLSSDSLGLIPSVRLGSPAALVKASLWMPLQAAAQVAECSCGG